MSNQVKELLGDFQKEVASKNPLVAQARRDNISPDDFRDKRKTGRNNSCQVTELQELHHEIKRRLFLGTKNNIIAEDLGCSVATVSAVRNSPVVKEELALMSASADVDVISLQKRVATLAPLALKNIEEAIETGFVHGEELDAKTILAESNKVMDREVGKPTQNIRSQNTHLHFTPDDLSKIKDSAMQNCVVIDIAKEQNEL